MYGNLPLRSFTAVSYTHLNYLDSIAGINIYPLISLVIFVSFFVGLLWYVFRMSRQEVDEMKAVPLDDGLVKKSILTILGVLRCV